jgi:hypothetical protein
VPLLIENDKRYAQSSPFKKVNDSCNHSNCFQPTTTSTSTSDYFKLVIPKLLLVSFQKSILANTSESLPFFFPQLGRASTDNPVTFEALIALRVWFSLVHTNLTKVTHCGTLFPFLNEIDQLGKSKLNLHHIDILQISGMITKGGVLDKEDKEIWEGRESFPKQLNVSEWPWVIDRLQSNIIAIPYTKSHGPDLIVKLELEGIFII